MLVNTVDKLIFATLLIIFLQMPILANEYHHFINGYYLATKSQVDSDKVNAKLNGYSDVNEMINDFKQNSNSAVRMDAANKEQTIAQYQQLLSAIDIFNNGNLAQQIIYMLTPTRWATLVEVTKNFQLGIPLNISSFVYSALAALLLSSLMMWPIKKLTRANKQFKRGSY
ncbi:DUF2937 family protein [Gammaproteobacteria bacterium AS21]